MRADRLISVLLLLQRHVRVTVRQVADELEISPRTARRDLEALMMAGVPVYSTAGRNGGWSLVGGASTDLSGLSEGEAKALFLAVGSSDDPDTVQALRKLGQALPEPFREAAATLASRSIVDHEAWGRNRRRPDAQPPARPEAFRTVADALAVNRELEFTYQRPRSGGSERVAQPLGIVHKAGRWYALCDTLDGRRSFRLDRIEQPVVTDREFEPPADFDLEAAWAESMEGYATSGLFVTAGGRVVDPAAWRYLHGTFGGRLRADPPGEGERFEVAGWSVEALARELVAFGDLVEIDSPPEVGTELVKIAESIITRYRPVP